MSESEEVLLEIEFDCGLSLFHLTLGLIKEIEMGRLFRRRKERSISEIEGLNESESMSASLVNLRGR